MKYKIALSTALVMALSACATAPTRPAATLPAKQAAETPPAEEGLAGAPVAELERLVAAGDIKAHTELGMRYGVGKGVEKNYDKAVALLRFAADRNDRDAEYYLGTAYSTGSGVPKDESVAVVWYERSAAQHLPIADYWMGFMIAYGKGGISPTWAGAIPYLWDGAVQGDSQCAFLLGYAYDKGTGIDRNVKAAAYWYRRADDKAINVKAEYNLLLLINHGEAEWQPEDRFARPDTKSPAKPQPEDQK